VPSLDFSDVAEAAFIAGPESLKKFSRLAKATINTFLVVDLLGCCCVYIVFVAESIQQVRAENYFSPTLRHLLCVRVTSCLQYLGRYILVYSLSDMDKFCTLPSQFLFSAFSACVQALCRLRKAANCFFATVTATPRIK